MMKLRSLAAVVAILAAVSPAATAQSAYQRCDSYNRSLDSVDNEILSEMFQRPMETAALIGTLAGVAGFMNENMSDDDRTALGGMALLGAAYCLWDDNQAASCARTAATLTYLFSQRDQHMNSFNSYNCRQYFSR